MIKILLLLLLATQAEAAYQYQVILSINPNSNLVPSSLSGFPVLVRKGTYSDMKTVANGGKIQNVVAVNGANVPADLVYSSTACISPTLYKWEITQSYSAATGNIAVVVRIPTLGTGVTQVYECFGDVGVTTFQGDVANTWAPTDNDYRLVVHHETSSDSCGNTCNSTGKSTGGTPTSVTFNTTNGFIDTGAGFSSGNVTYGTDLGLSDQAITVSAWIKGTAWTNSYNTIFENRSAFGGYGLYVKSTGKVAYGFFADGNVNGCSIDPGAATLSTGTWYYITAVAFSDNSCKGYINTTQDASSAGTSAHASGSNPLEGDSRYTLPFIGSIDELRVSNVSRSVDWITTEFNNLSDPTAFTSIGTATGGAHPTSSVSIM